TSVSEQVQSLTGLVGRLIDQNEAREEEVKTQVREIQALRQEMAEMKKLLQQCNSGKVTYATALTAGISNSHMTDKPSSSTPGSPELSQRMRVEDDKCAVTVNTSRFKGEKADFVRVKATL
ncbi:hypothetical protein LTR53_017716, partial [Teratosphaeriaceae sp. CCFEE 6253]